jgi:cytochrome b pre-mRNA-processing protein 3
MGFFRLLGRNRDERTGYQLYGAAVAAARQPAFYAGLGVPDTLDGRFDLVGLHVFLLIRRLRALPPPGPALAQAVFDAMFNDMDLNLREMGVGDLSVGKRVRAMWEAFHGRSSAYQAALEGRDAMKLAEALERNVWRGKPAGEACVALARQMLAQDAHLAGQDLQTLGHGVADFLPCEGAGP